MEKPRLDIDELEVTSFATSSLAPSLPGTIVSPGDPTAATWCYICPVRTQDCY